MTELVQLFAMYNMGNAVGAGDIVTPRSRLNGRTRFASRAPRTTALKHRDCTGFEEILSVQRKPLSVTAKL